MTIQDIIAEQIKQNPIILYMKGDAQFPQCGFSSRAVSILKSCGATQFKTINVLEDPDIRQGIKEYSNWPTIPQLYINGEFIGGSDIMAEMHQTGELEKLISTVAY